MRAFLPGFAAFAAALFFTGAALGQGTDRYTKVANQLVDLINATDYAGIQANFNKEMDAALPLDKSSEFFKELTQQAGKIQKLGKPQPDGEAMVFLAQCEKGTLDMQIALDNSGLIAGLLFKPPAATKMKSAMAPRLIQLEPGFSTARSMRSGRPRLQIRTRPPTPITAKLRTSTSGSPKMIPRLRSTRSRRASGKMPPPMPMSVNHVA